MATWTDTATLKTIYKALEAVPAAKINACIVQASNEIAGALRGRYDVSGWGSSAPSEMISLCEQLSYGLAARGSHGGDRGTPSDNSAKEARDEARALLKLYELGSRTLGDATGGIAAQRRVDPNEYARVKEPVFGMKDPLDYAIVDASEPLRGAGPDGMGIF